LINTFLDSLTTVIQNNIWFMLLSSFLAGLLTSLAPCSLMSIPLIINYIKGSNQKTSALKLSLIFTFAMALTYISLGIAASLLGKFLQLPEKAWHLFLGILSILMAFQMMDIFDILPSRNYSEKITKKGYPGAFITGILGGFFSSHHAAPVLVVLLGLTAGNKNVLLGILILIFFSIGHSVVIITAGTSVSFVSKLTKSGKYALLVKLINYMLGGFTILLGIYLIVTAFFE